MCGIAGVIGPAGSGRHIPRALIALRHRGPDSTGVAETRMGASFVYLAHTRLAIVDLSDAGRQPMANEDGSILMVFNGEIYNAPELRLLCEQSGHTFTSSMDGEVILHLWEMEGERCFARLNGIFAVAIADERAHTVCVARDPLGVKPVFYSATDAGLWFASELRALADIGAPLGERDPVALAQFLTFLWVPHPRTPFRGAAALPPGSALHWTPEGVTVRPYAEPIWGRRTEGPVVAAEFEERFCAATARQLLADVPVGLMASGGIDSSLIWWATKDRLSRAFCVSWDTERTGEGFDEDADAVRALSRDLGTDVEFVPGARIDTLQLPLGGDLIADPAYELTRTLAASAYRSGCKVLLSGQGADELLGGYRRHRMTSLLGRGPAISGKVARVLEGWAGRRPIPSRRIEYGVRALSAAGQSDAFRGYMELCSYSRAVDRAAALDVTEREVSDDVMWQDHRTVWDALPSGASVQRRAMLLDLAVYLPGLGLAYADRAGMEASVEIRVPWLDVDLVTWCLALPAAELFSDRRGKAVSRAVASRRVGAFIGERPKAGFGAPMTHVGGDGAQPGVRAFRQGLYFDRACQVLRQWSERAWPSPPR